MVDTSDTRRSYNQYCGIARGLDLVGERWTLLVVRELLLGPLRYGDLLLGLPGVGTNLLAKRLRDLEAAGLVERTLLPRPASAPAYQLTREGRRLERVVVELGRFGGRHLPQNPDDFVVSPRVAATGLKMTFRPAKAAGVSATYALELDDHGYTVVVDGTVLDLHQGAPSKADLLISTAAQDFLLLLSGAVTPRHALTSSDYTVLVPGGRDDHDAAETSSRLATFVDLFGWATRAR